MAQLASEQVDFAAWLDAIVRIYASHIPATIQALCEFLEIEHPLLPLFGEGMRVQIQTGTRPSKKRKINQLSLTGRSDSEKMPTLDPLQFSSRSAQIKICPPKSQLGSEPKFFEEPKTKK